MTRRSIHATSLTVLALAGALMLSLPILTSAQGVATLRTPGPDAEATAAPQQEADEQEAILGFAACMRDNGIDFPDPQFGVGGGFFGGGGGLPNVDFRSSEFLDAMESCESFLAALQPELDPEQQAEQVEQQVAFAQCMRERGLDFPDPDPVGGFDIGSLRGPDGRLAFDPFSVEFLAASSSCIAALDLDVPGPPGASGS